MNWLILEGGKLYFGGKQYYTFDKERAWEGNPERAIRHGAL